MNQDDRTRDIIEQAERIIRYTKRIREAINALDNGIAGRIEAVKRLGYLVDVRLDLEPAEENHDAFLADLLMLEILRTGDNGATRAHLDAAIRRRYGNLIGESEIVAALAALTRSGEVIDRDSYWHAKYDRGGKPSTGVPTTMKGKVLQVLETLPKAVGVKTIIKEIESRYGIYAKHATVAPVLTRLERGGRVRHEETNWSLIRDEEP